MHVKYNMIGARPEVTTRSPGRKTEPEAVGRRTVSERMLAENTVLDQLQTGSNKQPVVQGDHHSKEPDKDIQDLAALRPFSSQLNGIADGLGEVALETVQGVAELGVSGVKTAYDLLLGPTTSELEFAAEEITGQDVQFPEWAPDSDRGVERIQTGAGVIAEMVANPGLMVDAVVDPIKEHWAQGRYGAAVGRGIGEVTSVTVGALGAGRLVAEIPEAFKPANIMEWLPEKESPWTPGTTLLEEINKIREVDFLGSKRNCINCTLAIEYSKSGHPTSAIVTPDDTNGLDVEKILGKKFVAGGSLSVVELRMLKAGHGARGIVLGVHPERASNHTYNVENNHGKIETVDGQEVVYNHDYTKEFSDFILLITHENVHLADEAIKVIQAVLPGDDKPDLESQVIASEPEEAERNLAGDTGIDVFVVESDDQGINAINAVRETNGHPSLKAAERGMALDLYKAMIGDGVPSDKALGVTSLVMSPKSSDVLAHLIENSAAWKSNGSSILAMIGLEQSKETGAEESEGPDTSENAPEVVRPVPTLPMPEPELEESVDPAIENALVDLGIESDYVVTSYDEGIVAINAVREADGHAPLTAEEGAIALRVYNASIATEGSSGGALATAAIVLDPDNKAMLDKIVEQHEQIESGKITLSSVMGLGEPGQARSAADIAIAGTNIERLNNAQVMLDEQASNEMRMLHTTVTSAEEAIAEFNELGGLETDLTAEQAADFTLIFDQVMGEPNRTAGEAALMARYLLGPENAVTLGQMKDDLAGVREKLGSGMTLAQVVSEKEAEQVGDMQTFSSDLDAMIKLQQALGNTEGVLALTVLKGAVDIAEAHASEDNPVLADAAAIKELSLVTGKTFKQIMQMIGEGDLVAFAAVADDFGRGYMANASGEEMRTAAFAARGLGDLTFAIGSAAGSPEAMAAGTLTTGVADFFAGVAGEGHNGITAVGGGMALGGAVAKSVGLLTGDETLIQTGQIWSDAYTVLGGDSIATLINNQDYIGGGVAGARLGLNIAGVLISGEDGEQFRKFSALLGTGYDLFKAVNTSGPAAGSIAALSATAVVQVLDIAGVELAPEFGEMASTLAGALTAMEAGVALEATIMKLALLVQEVTLLEQGVVLSDAAAHQIASSMVESATSSVIPTAMGVAAVVFNVAMMGFKISQIADNDELDDTTKAIQSLDAFKTTLITTGVTAALVTGASANFWNPVGWGLMIAGVVVNAAASITDMIDNGPDRANISQFLLGDLSKVFGLGDREVNAHFSTSSPQEQSTAPGDVAALNAGTVEDGLLLHTGANDNKDVFLRMESPFGITSFSMHELQDKGRHERYEVIRDYKSTFAQMRAIDEALADGLNAADALNGQGGVNGQPGLSMASYGSGLVGNRIHQKSDAAEMSYGQMLENRYITLADRLGGSGTQAGQSFNAWMDGMSGKGINESGEAYTFAAKIAQHPVLLTIPPEIVERILSTVEPGSLTHVENQLTETISIYLAALNNPLVQAAKPMNESEAMDITIERLGLTEHYRTVGTPEVDAPESGEVLTAMAGIPQEVQDLTTQLNEGGMRDMPGGVALLGRADWNDKFYQLVVNGELDTYRYRGGADPHFEKVSRVIADLSGDYNNWPPGHAEGLGVDWAQLEAEGARNGDSQWVRNLEDPEVLRAMSGDDAELLRQALVLGSDMQALGKDVKVLGLSAFGEPGLVEVLIEGKQHAYRLEGDQFIQYSQRKLYLANPARLAA